MSNLIKLVYENFECNYTCGLSLRKFLRLLSVIGMISSVVYITVASCIIAHIVETEQVELFPNAYYRLPEGPIASRIVVPPPPSSSNGNGVEDFEIYRPKPLYPQFPVVPFQPQSHHHSIFPENINDDESTVRFGEQEEKAIYYRRNVGLFICLAATLIVINFIQLITDMSLFYSTLKGNRTTSYWVFFLLNIILWIMTLICFITIFTGGGIYLLLVFLTGTSIRCYTVYALHDLMNELRKPHDSLGEESGVASGEIQEEIVPEPRNVDDAETAQPGEDKETESDNENADDATGPDEQVEIAEEKALSVKSLQPNQSEDLSGDEEAILNDEVQILQVEDTEVAQHTGSVDSGAEDVIVVEEEKSDDLSAGEDADKITSGDEICEESIENNIDDESNDNHQIDEGIGQAPAPHLEDVAVENNEDDGGNEGGEAEAGTDTENVNEIKDEDTVDDEHAEIEGSETDLPPDEKLDLTTKSMDDQDEGASSDKTTESARLTEFANNEDALELANADGRNSTDTESPAVLDNDKEENEQYDGLGPNDEETGGSNDASKKKKRSKRKRRIKKL